VVPNLTVTGDGRWSALAGDRLYGWGKTVGYLYKAALRAELTETLGVSWGPVVKGAAEIDGLPTELLDLFSTRRAEVVAAMEAAGGKSAHAAEVAALATRTAKDHHVDLEQLRAEWHHRAQERGVELHPEEIFTRTPGHAPDRTEELASHLLESGGLVAHRSSFDRRDVLQAIAAGHQHGIRPAAASTAATALLRRPEVVPLASSTRQPGPRYSTAELLDIEAGLVASAAGRRNDQTAIVPGPIVERAFAARPSLSDEQKQMVASLTGSGAGVEVVVGRGGSGKTFALDAARAAWSEAGYDVIGAALAAQAATELQGGSGIPSTTIDRLLADLDQPGPFSPLRPETVVVIDEAAMVGTRKLARLAAHTELAGAKLVLIGDHRQVPEIEAGGAFVALQRVVPVSELAGNRRQVHQWERDALAELRAGSVPDAIAAYRRAGRICLADTADAGPPDSRRRLVERPPSRQAGSDVRPAPRRGRRPQPAGPSPPR
jgi:hypothetical protein